MDQLITCPQASAVSLSAFANPSRDHRSVRKQYGCKAKPAANMLLVYLGQEGHAHMPVRYGVNILSQREIIRFKIPRFLRL